MRNHTATHLLHAALRQVLGTHVKQAGSVVEPPRLRFDFTHYAAMDQAEIEEVERLVNEQILRNSGVETEVLPLEQAVATGAMALFGEKYGDQVRVVSVPGFQQGAVRRHARAPHRRYRRLQDRLRRQHFGGRPPHRSDYGRSRRAPVSGTHRNPASPLANYCALPSRNWSSMWRRCWHARKLWSTRSANCAASWRNRRRAIWRARPAQ